MEIRYGEGEFIHGDIRCRGTIILSDYKLLLRSGENDLTQSYVPTDRITSIRRRGPKELEVRVRLSVSSSYVAKFQGPYGGISALTRDLVNKLGLKKKFLRPEWAGESY